MSNKLPLSYYNDYLELLVDKKTACEKSIIELKDFRLDDKINEVINKLNKMINKCTREIDIIKNTIIKYQIHE